VGDERFRQRFQSVVPRELERINQIVEGLLRLARPTRLDLAPVHLPELIDQSLELYGEGIEAQRIAVVREYALGVPSIHADAAHLYQVLVNLVANAVEAMPDGGVLSVRCRWATLPDGSQSRIAWAWERRVEIEVEDTGPGIPASEQANVFSPFYTTKPAGTGLGLALAHKIVEDHGGTLTFRSVPGQGTAFVVLLPFRVAQPAPSNARAPDPGPAGEHVSRTLG
jgi:signal transduction histidine kinase